MNSTDSWVHPKLQTCILLAQVKSPEGVMRSGSGSFALEHMPGWTLEPLTHLHVSQEAALVSKWVLNRTYVLSDLEEEKISDCIL